MTDPKDPSLVPNGGYLVSSLNVQAARERSALRFSTGGQAGTVLTITADGRLERGEGFASDDEASVALFDVMSRTFTSCLSDLRQRAEKAEARLAMFKPLEPKSDLATRCLIHAATLIDDNWHTEAATLSEAAAEIERLQVVVDAASLYINGSDRELAELGITREDAVRRFHEVHAGKPPYTGVSG